MEQFQERPSPHVLRYFKRVVLVGLAFIILQGCSKKEEKPKYSVTYTFTSSAPSYSVKIWDITELNDFADSIHTPSFSKTIVYDYHATYRCIIENANNKASKKSISITYNGTTNTQSDSLYSSIESFIMP